MKIYKNKPVLSGDLYQRLESEFPEHAKIHLGDE
jgi:hypothetical protein